MFISGGWLLALRVTIHVRSWVYLEYPFLLTGVAFVSLGVVAMIGLPDGARRRGCWRMPLVLPVAAGLWSRIVIPEINILPFDREASQSP
jgi:hypothetical protein